MPVNALIEHINRTHGTDYRLDSRFPDGEQGAFRIESSRGPAVLKRQPDARVVRRYQDVGRQLERLRAAGYPAPRYLLTGTDGEISYLIQEVVPGNVPESLTPVLLDQLIRMNHLQQQAAPDRNPGWQTLIVGSVIEGMGEYCIVDTLRNHSPETASLLDVAQAAVRNWEGQPVPEQDIVHFDYHHRNVLVEGEQVTGVVDWDGIMAGDCVFDLVTLLFYTHDRLLRSTLLDEISRRATAETALAYLGHMIVRQLDWVIRFYNEEMVQQVIAMIRMNLDDLTPPASESPAR